MNKNRLITAIQCISAFSSLLVLCKYTIFFENCEEKHKKRRSAYANRLFYKELLAQELLLDNLAHCHAFRQSNAQCVRTLCKVGDVECVSTLEGSHTASNDV